VRPQPHLRLPVPAKRAFAAIGLLALALSACVKQGAPGVSIAPLKADIVFGVKPVAPPAAPANTVAETPAATFDATAVDTFNEKVLEIPNVTPIPRTPLGQAIDPCPAAALTAFPKTSADVNVKGTPAEGVYKFKRTLTVTKPGGTPATNTGFEQHVVRRVKQTPGKTYEFSYQVIQPDNLNPGQFALTNFRVNTNPAVVQNVNRPPQTIGVVGTPGVDQVVTPPQDEPGMFVDSITKQNKDGGAVAQPFAPVRPLKYLPLDETLVKPGQTFDTVGISPNSSQVVRHQGTVLRKTRVDACGEIVEGWLMDSTQTRSDSATNGDVKYFYNVATQFGAMFIAESTQLTLADSTKVAVDLSIADPKPQPLPDSLK
jgi:hypothetical protein